MVLKDEKWRARRYGMDAELVHNSAGETEHVRSVIARVIESLIPTAKELDCRHELVSIHDIVRGGSGYQRQRELYAGTGDFCAVIDMMIQEWETNRPFGW